MDLLAVQGQGCETPMPVAIETAKGLLVANLRAAGVPVYAINTVDGPVPGPVCAQPVQERRRGRAGAGQHPAH